MGNAIIDVAPSDTGNRVQVLVPQKGHYRYQEFTTEWPGDLLFALADLKGEWFCDSYARFENPNYIQKQIDQILALYNITLSGRRILDFGCGFGASSYCFVKRGANDVVAADLVKENTDLARLVFSRLGIDHYIDVRQEDVVPKLEPASFDIIWLQAVVEHLLPEERRTYLPRFWEALRPGGELVITETPNRFWPRETHTTRGRWFIPWMRPDAVFRKMRREEQYRSYSDVDFYRSGIIGSTYKEILACLGHPANCEERSRQIRGYFSGLYRDARVKSVARSTVVGACSLMEPVVRTFTRRPIMAYLPFLNHLVFRKTGRSDDARRTEAKRKPVVTSVSEA